MPESKGEGKTTRIGGFEILGRLGQGGMGTVYKARQVSMDRIVALKVLPPKLAKDKAFVQRFVREARSAARLSHPNIVQGIDVGVADGYYYFAMEFVDGPTVKAVLKREGRLDEKRALEIVQGVALALEHACEHGIVHRDIKPDNIMLTSKGEPKLADLGLARSTEKPTTVTIEGTALGTPYYMAPEQVRGLPDIDTRADIYALGATLHHLVTGQFPFDGPTSAAIMTKHVTDPAPSARTANPKISRACDELIQRMMAKDPADRPQTPAELLSDIADALAGKVHLRPGPRTKTRALASAPARRRTRPTPATVGGASLPRVLPKKKVGPWLFAGAGLLVLAIVVIWLATRGGGPPKPPPADPAQAAFQAADGFATQHPDRLDQAIARFQAVARDHPGTQWATVAANRVKKLQTLKTALAGKTGAAQKLEADIATLKATARDLAAKDRFGDAIKAIAAFAGKHTSREAADAAEALRRDVLAKAGVRFDTLADAADDAKGAGDYAKARAILKPVLSFGIPGLVEPAKRKLAKYDEEEKNAKHFARWDDIKAKAAKLTEAGKYDDALKLLATAKAIPLDDMADRLADEVAAVEDARQARLDAAIAAYQPESDKVWAAFKAHKYADADALLAALAKKPELRVGGASLPRDHVSAAHHLAADQQAARLLKAFWAAVEAGLDARKGFIAFGGEGGTITAVRNGQVTLKTPKGEVTLPIHKLGAKQALRYAVLKDDARSNLTKGVCLLAEETEFEQAGKAFAAAGDVPGVAIYRDRLDALRLGAAEHAARKAWQQIQRYAKGKLTRSRADRLRSLLDAFAAKHGNTKLGASVQRDLAALRDRVAAGEAPKAGEWQSLFDGKSLGGWRVAERDVYARHGKVLVDEGRIVLEAGAPKTAIVWARDFPRVDYEISVDAMRVAGKGDFCDIVFPIGNSQCVLYVGGWNGNMVGLSIDGRSANDNETTCPVTFQNGQWYRLRVRVTEGSVQVWVGEEKVIQLARAGHRFNGAGFYDALKPLGLQSHGTKAALRNIRLRRLGPEDAPRGEALKPGAWQSLFDGKSLRGWRPLDAKGTWRVEDGEIVGKGVYTSLISRSVLQPPYTLSLEAMKTEGRSYASALLLGVRPGGGDTKTTGYSILLYDLRGYALGLGHGFPWDRTRPGNLWRSGETRFARGTWHRLLLNVGTSGIALQCDGRPVFRVAVKQPTGGAVGLMASNSTHFRNIVWAKGTRTKGPAQGRQDRTQGGWQSLFDGRSLKGWRVVSEGEFAKHGEVRVRNGSIVLERGDRRTAIAWTREFPTTSYEIALEAMRVAGNEDFADIVFPLHGSSCLLKVGFNGAIVGLQLVDEQGAHQNQTTKRIEFEQGRWYEVRVRVTEDEVSAWIDDRSVIHLKLADHKLRLHKPYDALEPFGLHSYSTKAAVRNIRLRRLRPEAEERGEAPKAGEWQSLFDGTSLRGWEVAEGRGFGAHGKVYIRHGCVILEKGADNTGIAWAGDFPSIDYEVSLDVMWTDGSGGLCQMPFPLGASQSNLVLGGWSNTCVALDVVDGKYGDHNQTSRRMRFERDRWHRVRFQVTKARMVAWIDGERVLDLAPAGRRLGLNPKMGPIRRFGVATTNRTTAAIRNIRLRRLGPDAEPRGEAPKAGAWQSLFDGKTLGGWRVPKTFPHGPGRPDYQGGEVGVENGQIVLQRGGPPTAIVWTRDLPTAGYELVVEAMRVDGRGDFCTIAFPVGTSHSCLLVGAMNGTVIALEGYGRDAYERLNFENGRWYRVRLVVTNTKVEAWLDRDKLFDVPIPGHRLTVGGWHAAVLPFGIASCSAKAAVRNIRLRRLR